MEGCLMEGSIILECAYSEVDGDIVNLLSRHRGEWRAEVEKLVREDDSEVAEILKTLCGALDKRQAHAGLAEWIAAPSPQCQKKVFSSGGITGDTGYGVLLGGVAEATGNEEVGAA
jgi:hypothetical protein